MAIRIRVYPQNGALGMNGLGMNGTGAVSASTYFNNRLQSQKQISNLQLGYERALANEKIERARLEERMRNPYAMQQMGGFGNAGGFGGYGGYGNVGGYGSYGGFQGAQAYNPLAMSMIGSSLVQSQNFFPSLGLGRFF